MNLPQRSSHELIMSGMTDIPERNSPIRRIRSDVI